MSNINLMQGDCLERMKEIPSGSVDMILADPPYGTIRNAGLDGWENKNTDWDVCLDRAKMFEECDRILRKNGRACLFGQQPFTTDLIANAMPSMPFNYSMIWLKDHFANSLSVKKAPLNYYEDILIFSKRNDKWDRDDKSELRCYFYKILLSYGENKIFEIIKKEGRYKDDRSVKSHLSIKFGVNNTRFDLMDEKLFNFLSDNGIEFSMTYSDIREIHLKHRDKLKKKLNSKYPSVFNLPEGKKYKSNVLAYKKDYSGFHPTQKPIALLEDLIKTYTNEGDTVLDFTMGSGSTGVAAKNLNRSFIGIELDEGYFNIAKERINT